MTVDNIYMIVAMTEKTNSIGINGDMLYHLKDDLKYFRETTLGHTIVCGRKTYFSFPKRPLPGRKNVVVTRGQNSFDGALTVNSVEEVIEYATENPEEKIFICGGDDIYRQFIDVAKKLYVTEIEEKENVTADSHFPEIDRSIWKKTSQSSCIIPENAPKYRFSVYERI